MHRAYQGNDLGRPALAGDVEGGALEPIANQEVNAGVKELSHNVGVAGAAGEMKRGKPVAVAHVGIGIGGEEARHHIGVAFVGRHAQRRAVGKLDGVRVGPGGQQQVDDRDVVEGGRAVERALACGLRQVDVGTGRNERRTQVCRPAHRGVVQRGPSRRAEAVDVHAVPAPQPFAAQRKPVLFAFQTLANRSTASQNRLANAQQSQY